MNITIETLPIAVPTFRYSFAMYMNDNYTIQLHIQASVPLISCIEVNGLLGRRRFHPCGALESCSSNYMTYNLPWPPLPIITNVMGMYMIHFNPILAPRPLPMPLTPCMGCWAAAGSTPVGPWRAVVVTIWHTTSLDHLYPSLPMSWGCIWYISILYWPLDHFLCPSHHAWAAGPPQVPPLWGPGEL